MNKLKENIRGDFYNGIFYPIRSDIIKTIEFYIPYWNANKEGMLYNQITYKIKTDIKNYEQFRK